MTNNDIVQKLWNLCDVLRDDGINYSDYVTELVLLLFIKMVHENTEAGVLKRHPLPQGCRWTDINEKSGINLLNDYKRILLSLSTGKDSDGNVVHEDPLISAIYADAQTRLREPRHLEQMIKTLDQIDWFSAQKDGLGAALATERAEGWQLPGFDDGLVRPKVLGWIVPVHLDQDGLERFRVNRRDHLVLGALDVEREEGGGGHARLAHDL